MPASAPRALQRPPPANGRNGRRPCHPGAKVFRIRSKADGPTALFRRPRHPGAEVFHLCGLRRRGHRCGPRAGGPRRLGHPWGGTHRLLAGRARIVCRRRSCAGRNRGLAPGPQHHRPTQPPGTDLTTSLTPVRKSALLARMLRARAVRPCRAAAPTSASVGETQLASNRESSS
jgi:hypothetical protein